MNLADIVVYLATGASAWLTGMGLTEWRRL